jgi:hypothetical protein
VEIVQTYTLPALLLAAWVAWWLLAVNWEKAWAFLGQGAWVPLVLLMVLVATVWAALVPAPCDCLGLLRLPNFWWQLGAVSSTVAVALFCGWLQRVVGFRPAEVNLEPPAPHGHGHGNPHGHGH